MLFGNVIGVYCNEYVNTLCHSAEFFSVTAGGICSYRGVLKDYSTWVHNVNLNIHVLLLSNNHCYYILYLLKNEINKSARETRGPSLHYSLGVHDSVGTIKPPLSSESIASIKRLFGSKNIRNTNKIKSRKVTRACKLPFLVKCSHFLDA